MPWSLDEFCASHRGSTWEQLPASSVAFLKKLDLTTIHPYCQNASAFLEDPAIPSMGPLREPVDDTTIEALVTFAYAKLVPFCGFLDLWIRLVSGFLAPIGVMMLILENQGSSVGKRSLHTHTPHHWNSIVITFCSMIVMVDSMYVNEFGCYYGATLFLLATVLSLRIAVQRRLVKSQIVLFLLIFLALYLTFDWRRFEFQFGDPFDVNRTVESGLYYSSQNGLIHDAVSLWPEHRYLYSAATGATPWMLTGDVRTGLPFYLNYIPDPFWTRVYLPTADGEVLALDIAFPENGHNASKPLYLILHGVNGGSKETYATDLTWRRTRDGSTVIIMISRGLMDVPMRGWDLFHGARWQDAHTTAVRLRQAMDGGENQILAGVGYSMGAIVLNNYVASAGPDCALDVAFSISGALECRNEQYYRRAMRTWEPMIAENIRSTQHLRKWGQRLRARLGRDAFRSLMRATNIVELDKYTAVAYNRFRDLNDFYSQMGALGDIAWSDLDKTPSKIASAKVFNISIPLCVMHAFEDPISSWRTVAASDGFLEPNNLVHTGEGNLVLLLTEKGGHVGWPIGWLPFLKKWEFMNEAAASFVDAVAEAKRIRYGKFPEVNK
jgi:predicted alpha/beta-fold hydrolase